MEDDECENANEGAWREGIYQKDRCRQEPNHPEHNTHPAKALAEGKEMGYPQDEDHQVEAILYRARRSNVGKPYDPSLGFGRFRSHEYDHYEEDENEDDAAHDTGQTTHRRTLFSFSIALIWVSFLVLICLL